jgi:hypothetical protein
MAAPWGVNIEVVAEVSGDRKLNPSSGLSIQSPASDGYFCL